MSRRVELAEAQLALSRKLERQREEEKARQDKWRAALRELAKKQEALRRERAAARVAARKCSRKGKK